MGRSPGGEVNMSFENRAAIHRRINALTHEVCASPRGEIVHDILLDVLQELVEMAARISDFEAK
jgi:hypothetical protein